MSTNPATGLATEIETSPRLAACWPEAKDFDKIDAEVNELRGRRNVAKAELVLLGSTYDQACRELVHTQASAEKTFALRSQIEALEAQVHGLDLVIAEKEIPWRNLKLKRDAKIVAEAAARQKQDAQEKWEGIVAQCRAAAEEVQRLERAFPGAEEKAIELQNKCAHAAAALLAFEANRLGPSDYPSPSELQRENKQLERLKAVHGASRTKRDEATAVRDGIRNDWLEARARLETVASQELFYRVTNKESRKSWIRVASLTAA